MRFVFLSYNLEDQRPEWIQNIQVKTEGDIVFYDQWEPFMNQLASPYFVETMTKATPAPRAVQYAEAFKLDPDLFKPAQEIEQKLRRSDNSVTHHWLFQLMYALVRCDVLLLDFDKPVTVVNSQSLFDVLHAHLFDIPIICIAERFILQPWVTRYSKVIVKPDPDEILAQIALVPKRAWQKH